MLFPAYTRENERTLWGARNEERGTGQNQKGFHPFFLTIPETVPLPLPSTLSPPSSPAVTEEELRKLLPGCKSIYV